MTSSVRVEVSAGRKAPGWQRRVRDGSACVAPLAAVLVVLGPWELFDQHGSHRALVVRPDRYVLGVADDAAALHQVGARPRVRGRQPTPWCVPLIPDAESGSEAGPAITFNRGRIEATLSCALDLARQQGLIAADLDVPAMFAPALQR